jgi:hypothetical protein
MAFDYEAELAKEPDPEAVRRMDEEIRGSYRLPPLTPEEIAKRDLERKTQREESVRVWRKIESRLEREQAAKAEQERAEWLKEHRKQEAIRQRERAVEIDRQVTQQSLRDMRMAAARQDAFQHDVRTAHVQNVRQQYTTSLFAELEKAINESVPLKPSPNFATLYRENQRSGRYYVEPEDTAGGDK